MLWAHFYFTVLFCVQVTLSIHVGLVVLITRVSNLDVSTCLASFRPEIVVHNAYLYLGNFSVFKAPVFLSLYSTNWLR
jgi:hypothetical protein